MSFACKTLSPTASPQPSGRAHHTFASSSGVTLPLTSPDRRTFQEMGIGGFWSCRPQLGHPGSPSPSHPMLPLLPSFDSTLGHYQLVLRSLSIFGTCLFLRCADVPVLPGAGLQRDSVWGAGHVLVCPAGPGLPPWDAHECLPSQGCECLPGPGMAGVQVQLWLHSVILLFA